MKYDLIAEAYVNLLIEGRIDDLKSQNPHLVNEIDSYVNADPTPQKKFVPWLVSQHKKGNVTPDEPSLNQTLSGFETYKSRHGIRDHSSKSYQQIKDAVQPFLGTAATKNELKKQQIHAGIDQIYSSPDNKIQAFHVKTKEASQHVYGGGEELGGLHTGWCVSARSGGCRFGRYGPMYTIHVKDDPKSPYAVHPYGKNRGTITTRYNDGDESLDVASEKIPHLKNTIDIIKKTANSPELKNEEIKRIRGDLVNSDKETVINALHHPLMPVDDINNVAMSHPDSEIAIEALHSRNADYETTYYAAQHPNPEVAMSAMDHHLANIHTIETLADHPNKKVRDEARRRLDEEGREY